MEERRKSLPEYLPHVGKRKMKSVLAVLLGFFQWQLVRLVFPALCCAPGKPFWVLLWLGSSRSNGSPIRGRRKAKKRAAQQLSFRFQISSM